MSDDSRSALDPDKIPRRRGLHIREIKEEAPEPELTVGYELKTAREEAGKDLNDVAAALRIKPEHLIALEASEYDKLPAKTYVVGFVRQYAQNLGMNANEMVERLKTELEGPKTEPEETAQGKTEGKSRRTAPASGLGSIGGTAVASSGEDESRLPTTTIAVAVILVLVVILGGWYLTRPSEEANTAADTEEETGSTGNPATADESENGTPKEMPEPPVVPASARKGAGDAGSAPARSGGSLTALLPGADRMDATSGANAAEGGEVPPDMPDAAAAAVPIEHSNDASAEGAEDPDAGDSPEQDVPMRTGDVAETAMPQPKLALRTVKSHLPGVPEDAITEDEDAEPALEEIEAEGVGGEVKTGDEAAAPTSTKPRPKRAPEETAAAEPEPEPAAEADEPAVYGAANAKSRVTLRVRSSTWVRVEDADGRVIIERDMISGDSFRAPDKNGLYLVTKDAGAIELMLDGQSIGRAGRPDQVLTGLLLSPDQLKQRVAQNTAPTVQ